MKMVFSYLLETKSNPYCAVVISHCKQVRWVMDHVPLANVLASNLKAVLETPRA